MIFLILILFFFVAITAFFSFYLKNNAILIFILLGILLILIAAFRNGESFRDYDMYVNMFQGNNDTIVEPSFVFIRFIVKFFLGDNSIYLFIIFAIIGVSLKFIAIKQLTELWFYSILIYLSNFFILHEMTQIRVGVASALFLLCIKPIYERNLKRFLLFAFLAFTFHFSALIILPLWFLNTKPQKTWLIILVPISYIIYFLGVNFITVIPISGIKEKIEIYQQLQELGGEESLPVNVFNLVFLTKIFLYYFFIYKYDLLLSYNVYFPLVIKIYCISLVSYIIFSQISAFATRISELFGIVEIILIPFVFYIFRPIYFSKLLVIFIGFSFLLIVLFYVKLIEA